MAADTVPPMTTSANNAAVWATGAANKFREVSRGTENPSTKLLAEGLTHLAEAIRELDLSRCVTSPYASSEE
ncbi:hypothetical protein B1790_02020 [Mycobacterium sp. AT1]|nr:hypothetical protein B1790_02020 [Mycobacterium sp. AT1]